MKSHALADEAQRIFGEEVHITTNSKRHLGAGIGSKNYKDQYCKEIVSVWREEFETLAKIAKWYSSIHRIHKGIQIKVHILHANNNRVL